MVFAISSNTGWAESFILWKLPLSRALQYWHAWLYANGIWTIPKQPAATTEFDRLMSQLPALLDTTDDE